MKAAVLFLFSAALASEVGSTTLTVEVRDRRGLPVANAVAWAVPAQPSSIMPRAAVMDQKNRMFVPHVLVVQTGASVSFPNSDDVQHQVYSFSPVRAFQLPLYKGNPPRPIVFDKPGVVSLGCNIHDRMSAWIVVVDTPWFGLGERGRVRLEDLPAGEYNVHVWYPGMREAIAPRAIRLTSGDEEELTFSSPR